MSGNTKKNFKFFITAVVVLVLVGSGWGIWKGSFFSAQRADASVNPVTPNVPIAKYEMKNGVKVFHLTAEQVKQEVSKGVFVNAWGYNGSTPGPTIVVNEGDKIQVVVDNKLPGPTTVHWHGLIVPNNMDGVPGAEPSPVIEPGKSFTYEFTVKQVGTFMYHSHYQPSKDEMMGLDGMFISLPKNGDTVNGKPVNRDYSILLQEWQLQKPGSANGMDMSQFGEGQVPVGTYDVNPEGMSWNTFTLNGKQFPSTDPMEVKQGDKVLVRLANLSMQSHPMHLHGHNFKVVAKDGNPLPESAQYMANTINIAAGETYDIEFTADNPGTWVFHCHLPHHTAGLNGKDGGMLTAFHYQGTPWPPAFTAKTNASDTTSNMNNTNQSSDTMQMSGSSSNTMNMPSK
ncbi:copper oxidase [Fodinisporobacter ferrooxydans]|uniref:Copper oxidase n=1 Tax=Fodinisporobacter ferrooxydans TaxID=2901836 RepID=A0ABY4CK68_9BACL|nr:copper oxidase [Alicyclobacillaceae bacterium MYW30-H2]